MSERVIEEKGKKKAIQYETCLVNDVKITYRHREREIPSLLGRECKQPHITELE